MSELADNGIVARKVVSSAARTALLGLLLVTLVLLFWATFESMVAIWWRSETFAHGFLVLPCSGYLIWRKRRELAQLSYRTDFRAVVPLWVLGFGWLLAYLTGVLVVEQLAVVAMIPILVWLILGLPALRLLAFPLAFLVFAVPMGEQLVYPLMQFTAVFTVTMLRFTGIPVYWEGTFLSIPSGDWSVVEACSGIRYLIASVFLGALYAYLSYRSFWRRALFVALAFAVPVLANGLRAYIIVMVGHLSNMKLAVGVDHLIYGWVFFGVVMFLLFWVGALWREPMGTHQQAASGIADRDQTVPDGARRVSAVVAIIVLSLAIWPAWAAYLEQPGEAPARLFIHSPEGRGLWQPIRTSFTDWKPRYLDYAQDLQQDYQRGEDLIGLFVALYDEREGELVNSRNVMVPETDPVWRMPHQKTRVVTIDGTERAMVESQLQSSRQRLLVWHWYWINGDHLANDFLAKVRGTVVMLSGANRREAGIVVYTSMDEQPQRARERLQRFLGDMLPGIEESLKQSFNNTGGLSSQQ